jgi:Protein of unknown function (DUF3987)
MSNPEIQTYSNKAKTIEDTQTLAVEIQADSALESSVAVDTVDRDTLARTQLEALGYAVGDTVYLRFFPPIRGKGGKNDEFVYPAVPWNRIDNQQTKGWGCYFVVNGQSQSSVIKATGEILVKLGKAVFYEHDDLSRELQLDLWKSLNLPVPTIQIDTGGKSIHSYWVFDEPCQIDDWKRLQSDLLEFSNADKTIKDPSRVMRLAGAVHISKTGVRNPTTIVSNSGNRYSFDELRSAVPTIKVEPSAKVTKNVSTICTSVASKVESRECDVPLEKCISIAHRDAIYRGVEIGSRNSTAKALASELIGTARFLDSICQPYSGSGEELYEKYGDHCDTASLGELAGIWSRTSSENPNPCLDAYKIQNCINAWYVRQLTVENVKNYQPEDAKRFTWDKVEAGFPADVTEAYKSDNSYRDIEADVAALMFITTISSEIGGLCITDTGSPLNLFSLVVGESGSGKSGKMSALSNGLNKADKQRSEKFNDEMSRYKRTIEEYEIQRKESPGCENEEPVRPLKDHTLVQKITGEALMVKLNDQESQNRGLLAYYNEFKTFLGAMNKYNGASDEWSTWLSLHSGMKTKSDTKSGGEIEIESPKISAIGGIQPPVLMKYVEKTGTEDGWWARWILSKTYVIREFRPFERDRHHAQHLKDIVERYVEKIQAIEGVIRSEMTDETNALRTITGRRYIDELDIANNREAHLKTMDHIDRIAAVLSVIEKLNNGSIGDLAPVHPHHYLAALNLCENSLAIWEELSQIEDEKSDEELVVKAHKVGKRKGKLDSQSIKNWVKGDKAQKIIQLVYDAYGGNLTKTRSNTLCWQP